MHSWVRCSLVLSIAAILTLALLLCRNAGWLPDATLLPLRVAAVATSTVAGLLGLVLYVVLSYKDRPRQAWIIGGLAFFAGLPALAVILHALLPSD